MTRQVNGTVNPTRKTHHHQQQYTLHTVQFDTYDIPTAVLLPRSKRAVHCTERNRRAFMWEFQSNRMMPGYFHAQAEQPNQQE